VDQAKQGYDDLVKVRDDMADIASKHKQDNAAYLKDATDAEELVDTLSKSSAKIVSEDLAGAVSDEQGKLDTLTQATADGVSAVEDARGRLATLIDAKKTQDAEEAALTTRKTEASTALDTAKANRKAAHQAMREVM